MADNKVNNSLDFRNVKQTQFSQGQVLKGSFSELQSALRTYNTTSILKDSFTHFVQELDDLDRPVVIDYYQAISPSINRLFFVSDVSNSLAGKWFSIEEPITKKVHVFWYRVSSNGTEPASGDIRHVIDIDTDEMSELVTRATEVVIKGTNQFIIRNKSYVSSYLDIEYLQFGNSQLIDISTSGFSVSNIQAGESFNVGYIELEYDVDNNPIYNGNILKGFKFNPFTGSFETSNQITVTPDLSDLTGFEPIIYNVTMEVADTEYSLELPVGTKRIQMNIRDHLSPYKFSFISNGNYISKSYGVIYNDSNLKIDDMNNMIYFKANKNNMVMEILVWK